LKKEKLEGKTDLGTPYGGGLGSSKLDPYIGEIECKEGK